MANVNVYPEHREVLDGLITSAKVGSQVGATATGPFKEQREAFVFAAAIGMALGKPASEGDLPKSKSRETISIRDNVLFGAEGAKEISLAAILIQDLEASEETDAGLRRQLDEIADSDLTRRFALLDRYAYSGFSWLRLHMKDAATIRDLVMEAIDKVISVDVGVEEFLLGKDPLGGFLI